jgi:hypothetical protein
MTTIKAIRLASVVTAINVLVASGFSIAGIIRPQYLVPAGYIPTQASLILALYAAARTIPLALFALWAIYKQATPALLILGALAGAIPLSNTNQLWGLAWGALVFGELNGADRIHIALVVGGSLVMILGALAISTAVASAKEMSSTNEAVLRECNRYGLDYDRTIMAQAGDELGRNERKRWWDYAILLIATGIFVRIGLQAHVPPLAMDLRWAVGLGLVLILSLVAGGVCLWRRTGFY